MHTLHETMIATKTVEYLMGAAYLLLFVLFWRWLSRRPRNE